MSSRSQIIATLGPSSSDNATFLSMVERGADIARLNFSWGDPAEKSEQIRVVRAAEEKTGRRIPVIADLPGPRVQRGRTHSYEASAPSLTDKDKDFIRFAGEKGIDWIALSFVRSAADVEEARSFSRSVGGPGKIIAKIERQEAVDNIDDILEAADAIMIARGDLGDEIPVETLPFVQAKLASLANEAEKPVITATEMLLSMTKSPRPTRAEVTDVANAIMQGSDAVMLSEETATGDHPSEAVAMMEKIVSEAERHITRKTNQLS